MGKKKNRYAGVVEPEVQYLNPEFAAFVGQHVPYVEAEAAKADNVNHPAHYTNDPSGIECIQITRHRNFNIGNAIKYLWRAGLKDSGTLSGDEKQVEDLRKAIFYIEDEIARLTGQAK